ncbi:hypothetical protein CQ040_02675 [Microbacterium sp. MYb54]|nr:hypothetical protein CQ032_04150 [Microbacterium sp. MYb43]PRB22941.1 hypothetical protein CQ037_18055 [Microbacterium sp. MYb50]PRB24170.1 hypothetical protein CQ040_02675 [Microbacterium sp. MYb54]
MFVCSQKRGQRYVHTRVYGFPMTPQNPHKDLFSPLPKLSRRSFLIAGSVAAVSVVLAEPAFAASSFQVSTSKVDITPEAGYPMAGFATATEPRRAAGVNEPLMARCTILWDDGAPNVIVSADVLAFGRTMHQQIRAGVTALGVGNADFVLNATHTHNGPVLIERLDPYISYAVTDMAEIAGYSDWLVTEIIALVSTALSSPRTTCTLDYLVTDENFSYNRIGLSYVETAVPTLVARATDGTPRAVLFSYGAHPVAGGAGALFDPDYPSEAIKTIEASYDGVFAQFVLGPAGDQNPLTLDGYMQSDAYGYDLGLTVANAIATPGRTLTGPILTAISEVSLPLEVTENPANRAALQQVFQSRELTGEAPYIRRHGQTMKAVAADASAPLDTTVPLPVQRWRFAGAPGLTMIFSGGEVVSGYAVYFRSLHGGTNELWFTAYANEVPGYIPSDEVLANPGYEAGYGPDYPGVASHSMAAYGHLAHFRLQGASGVGVQQVYIDHVASLI